MGRIVVDFDIQYGGEATKTLRADAERVYFFKNFEAQFFGAIECGTSAPACLQFMDIHRLHHAPLSE